jgi:hypothetical protein
MIILGAALAMAMVQQMLSPACKSIGVEEGIAGVTPPLNQLVPF